MSSRSQMWTELCFVCFIFATPERKTMPERRQRPDLEFETYMKRHTFITRICKIGILRSVFVPSQVVKALGGATRIPVLARYAGETTRSTLMPAGGAKRRLVLQMSMLRPVGLDVGDLIEVSLESTTESHKQPLPPDLARALQFRPTAAAELERSPPSTWRIIVERLELARTADMRQQRVERIVERLVEMAEARVRKKGSSLKG